jgi:hypothetical protein
VNAQACASMQAASNAASSGDTINIVDGSYGGQELAGTKTLSFRGAGPGRPSFGMLLTSAANVSFKHLLVENRDEQPTPFCNSWNFTFTLTVCAPNVSFDDVIVDGLRHPSGDPQRRGGLGLDGDSTALVFKNGEIRGVHDAKGFQGGADNMVIENNYWHDIRLTPAGGAVDVHNECAYITGGDNQVWRGNRFILCPVMSMFFANFSDGPPFAGALIENNVFTHTLNDDGSPHQGASFVIPAGTSGNNQVRNWVIRFNTFEGAPDIARTPSGADDNGSARFYGNLGADPDCDLPEWTLSYNVGTTCGALGERWVANATNSANSPFYVNAPAQDFHLKSGVNEALNIGAPTFPGKDLDGNARPFGASADAGAYERQS